MAYYTLVDDLEPRSPIRRESGDVFDLGYRLNQAKRTGQKHRDKRVHQHYKDLYTRVYLVNVYWNISKYNKPL